MMTVTALCHDQFRQLLWSLASNPKGTQMERDLASLALSLYDANPEHPAVVNIVNQYAKRAVDAA
jgi:hypothetical protein